MEGRLIQFNLNAYKDLLSDLPWIEVDDRHKKVSRSSCWMVDKGCTCTCEYGHSKPWKPTLWPKWVKNAAPAIEERLNLPVHSLNSWMEIDMPQNNNNCIGTKTMKDFSYRTLL